MCQPRQGHDVMYQTLIGPSICLEEKLSERRLTYHQLGPSLSWPCAESRVLK